MDEQPVKIFNALASDTRLQILDWLKDPVNNFRPQKVGDMIESGVCGTRIAERLDFSLPTISRHMKILVDAGLVESKRIKQWTFYKRSKSGASNALIVLKNSI